MQAEIIHSEIGSSDPAEYESRMTLNIRIRDLRQAKGWTLAELADRIGVSIPHLSEIERGKKNLNNHLIERLCQQLDVQPPELFTAATNPDMAELVDIMKGQGPEAWARVLGYARAVADSDK